MFKKHILKTVVSLFGSLVLFSACAMAQGIEGGTKEVAGYTGFVHFAGDGSTTKALLGGSIGAWTSSRTQILADVSYVPMGFGVKLANFGGALHINVADTTSKVVPYVALAGGLGHHWVEGFSNNHGYFGGGAGVRVFAGKNWGVRPEFLYLRRQGDGGGDNTYRVSFGVFYQFGK
jgi:hypothetical protein